MRYSSFQQAVLKANHNGMTFTTMSYRSNQKRSQVWFNNVANGSSGVNPPPPDIVPDIAKALGITSDQCAALICEGWYQVRSEEVSARVRRLAPALDALTDADADLIEQLAMRLVQN